MNSQAPAFPAACAVLIPAFQAAASLPGLLEALLKRVPGSQILVVDDGSRDATASLARSQGVGVLVHGRNRGKGAALASGLKALRRRGFGWAITMDADGQHIVEDIEAFLPFVSDPSVGIAVGRRKLRGTSMPWHRRFSNWTTTALLSRLAGRPVFDAQSGFRMYNLGLAGRGLLPDEGRFDWEPQVLVLACRNGFGLACVPINTLYNSGGSHIRVARDTLRFLRMYWRLAWMR